MTHNLDLEYLKLFLSIRMYNKTLKRVVIFENFNQQYPIIIQRLNGECNNIRKPNPVIGRLVALASVTFEHLAASFLVDASDFFQLNPGWKWADLFDITKPAYKLEFSHHRSLFRPVSKWPRLSSLALTSKHFTPDGDPAEIGAVLQAAAVAAMNMPQLEIMEIWNGRKGLAALFKYETSRKYRQATITWRGTWRLIMEQSVIQAWEAVLQQWGGWRLNIVQETLDEAVIKSHGDAIHYLELSNEVIRPISLQQIRHEQKAMEGREDAQQG